MRKKKVVQKTGRRIEKASFQKSNKDYHFFRPNISAREDSRINGIPRVKHIAEIFSLTVLQVKKDKTIQNGVVGVDKRNSGKSNQWKIRAPGATGRVARKFDTLVVEHDEEKQAFLRCYTSREFSIYNFV